MGSIGPLLAVFSFLRKDSACSLWDEIKTNNFQFSFYSHLFLDATNWIDVHTFASLKTTSIGILIVFDRCTCGAEQIACSNFSSMNLKKTKHKVR